MNQRFRWLSVTIALVLAVSCKPKGIEYLSLDDIEILKMGYPRSLVGIKATFYNPNPVGCTLESLQADLTVDGKPMGKVQLANPLEIARKDTFQIPLELDIETLQSLKSLAKWIVKNKNAQGASIAIKGEALLRKKGISIRYPVLYKGNIPKKD